MGRPVAYLRKSKVTSDRHLSWQVQESEIRALAERHGDTEPELLSDWNRSGGAEKTRLRGDYKRLRDMIEAGEVSVVYAYSLSRLSRSLIEYASLAGLCRDRGVKIRLCKEGEFDYSQASQRFVVNILASLAEMERDLAKERSADTIAVRRARGDHLGSAGYGRRLVNGKLEPDPAANVPAVLDAFREAGSFSGAARLLNQRGLASARMSRSWSGNTVARVIRRDAPGELAGRRIEPRVRVKGSFTLSRLLRCSCGQVMTGRSTKHRTKYGNYGPYVSYVCFRGRYEPSHPRPYIVTERAILPWVQIEAARLRPPDAVEVVEGDDAQLTALETHRTRILDNYEDGLIDKAKRDAKLAVIAEKIDAAEVRGRVVNIPEIDWSWRPEALNDVLTAVFDRIGLDATMRPVEAVWRVPEWRA